MLEKIEEVEYNKNNCPKALQELYENVRLMKIYIYQMETILNNMLHYKALQCPKKT